jgi:carboxylesterase type B
VTSDLHLLKTIQENSLLVLMMRLLQDLPVFNLETHSSKIPQPQKTGKLENYPATEEAVEYFSLHLDVFVPPLAGSASAFPVKVWIYGGGEDAGGISNPLYDGCNLAEDDSIMVSVNYRLGPLGFLALETAGIGGNFGIQDIIMGLQWIQTNIAAFGGDPVRI